MTAEAILVAVLRLNLVASVAIALVLALRLLAARPLGARVAYWLWLVVPMAAASCFLPGPERTVIMPPAGFETVVAETERPVVDATPALEQTHAELATRSVLRPVLADVLVALWLVGSAALLTRSILSTRRLAADPSIGPALVGVLRPKLVLPADFETRFDTEERALIRAHEEVHRASGHTIVNALVELVRCASWFNPIAHFAVTRFRMDQELACDAAVIADHPSARRAYAEALLKAHVAPAYLPLGCTWTSPSARRLGDRIATLGRPPLSRRRAIVGGSTIALVGLALAYAAWAQQPERLVAQVARPEPTWTPAAEAPVGVLSHKLEGQRHDAFIERAKAGNIDLVFFGPTDTEMWSWKDRGRDVWDREFGSLKAANFGSQGTGPRSLPWRMRNGELDGYQAKLIVLLPWHPGDDATLGDRAEFTNALLPLVAEIRARQPQAKLLIMAPLPRGAGDGSLEQWRQRANWVSETLSKLADNQAIFFVDISERFFDADGSFKRETWSTGRQKPGFEIWAEELRPWLDRFVH
jgi:beta-lactamase regulating signal transducer with metallopeptidase domain